MSLAQELLFFEEVDGRYYVSVSDINSVENVNERLDEILAFIESSHIDRLWLDEPPVSEELGRRVHQAFASNPHTIAEIQFVPLHGVAMRDLIPWIASRGTIGHMTSLEKVAVFVNQNVDVSIQDYDVLFSLLLTSTSLRELFISFDSICDDDVMSALARYLGTSSVVTFSMCQYGVSVDLSQAAFCSLCDGVAQSTLQKLVLGYHVPQALNLEPAAESLAWAIVQSSLEEVMIWDTSICLALVHTKHVKNLDFAFIQIGSDHVCHLLINRKWKPLLGANIPLGLWPRILEKAYILAETSHGPAGILFYLLRQKPDLVPCTSHTSLGKRKRTE